VGCDAKRSNHVSRLADHTPIGQTWLPLRDSPQHPWIETHSFTNQRLYHRGALLAGASFGLCIHGRDYSVRPRATAWRGLNRSSNPCVRKVSSTT